MQSRSFAFLFVRHLDSPLIKPAIIIYFLIKREWSEAEFEWFSRVVADIFVVN